MTGELALDERGKILGLRVDALHDMGSHVFDASMVVPLFALKLAPGVYQVPAVYAAGERGTLVRFSDPVARSAATLVDLGTTCTLRALFSRGEELWVIGSDGGRSAVWRITGSTVFHWGQCP